MESTRRDLFVGLFILISVGVMVGTLVLTSRVLERRIPLYLRLETGEGISEDTPVLLQGLRIGRVGSVTPRVDTLTLSTTFVAELRVRETFADGTNLYLPVGTEAIIAQPPAAFGETVIRLQLPAPTPTRVVLQPGDTIPSRRSQELLEAVQTVVDELRNEVRQTLEDSRTTLATSNAAVIDAQSLMDQTRPSIIEALDRLNANLEKSASLIDDVAPRISPMYDSLTAVLGDTRQLLATIRSITDSTQLMLSESGDPLRATLQHMQRTAEVLEHFSEQVSRRPTRLLTGVEPPARDTTGGSR